MDLFIKEYGWEYPYKKFYDTVWLTKSVYSDDTIFLVAKEHDKIVGTGSVFFSSSSYSDLIGEFGRLVVDQKYIKNGIGTKLLNTLVEKSSDMIQYGFAECRSDHQGSQKICEREGFFPTGFEPNKYHLRSSRESAVFVSKLFNSAYSLRRNNPHVIACIYPVAVKSMQNLGLDSDQIVEADVEGYPTEKCFTLEEMKSNGISPLLRIQRGRVKNPEVFGNLSLSHGFFKITHNQAHYLMAKDKDIILGAIGFSVDIIDKKIKVIELIEFDDEVKGFLLKTLVDQAKEKYGAQYIEIEISAYAPKMQKTLDQLGFIPVAYCPSMVFRGSERLDVIRMAKLNFSPDIEHIKLTDLSQDMLELIMKDLECKKIGIEITEVTRRTNIFQGLSDGELSQLAQICKMITVPAGETICRQGERGLDIYVLAEGKASVMTNANNGNRIKIGSIDEGEIFGEMAIIEDKPRTADLITEEESAMVMIDRFELENLMNKNNHLGKVIMKNLAQGLSQKLRRS